MANILEQEIQTGSTTTMRVQVFMDEKIKTEDAPAWVLRNKKTPAFVVPASINGGKKSLRRVYKDAGWMHVDLLHGDKASFFNKG